MRAVNLLPREDTRRSEARKPDKTVAMIGAVGGGIVVLALAAGFVVAGRDVNTQRANLESARAELAATPRKPSRTSQKRAALASERNRRAVALASALSQRVSWDRVLRRLALVLPDDIWLTSLAGTTAAATDGTTAAAPAGATTAPPVVSATPSGLSLDGYAYSQQAVARLLSRLQVIPDLKNVQLKTSKTAEKGGHHVVQFSILSDIRHGSDAA
jgi:Tfp pilus assembly protein PilN